MYERRIEYSLYKTMGEFRKLRQMREVERGTEKPSRAGERWGKPHPTCAAEEPSRAEERWGKPQPTSAAEPPARQTKPIGGAGHAESSVRPERRDYDRHESRSGGPASREPGSDCAKRSQCATG
jgi:hypothetical protein